MATSQKIKTVSAGGATTRLWQDAKGRWLWHFYRDGKRCTGSAVKLSTARAKSKAYLAGISGHGTALVKQQDISEFRSWQTARRKTAIITDIFAAYVETLRQSGRTAIYVDKLESDLAGFSKKYGREKIAIISPEQIEQWLSARNVGPRRYNNLLATLVSAFQFARARDFLPEGKTAPDRIPRRSLPRTAVKVFTPDQLLKILLAAEKEWRPAIAIQAFAGARTAEVGRLYWRNVNLDKRLIEIPADASKTGRRRLIPLLDPIPLWLPLNPDPDEMLCPYEGHQVFLERMLRRNPAIQWVTNGLRHSYGSYRCAVLRDMPAVAFEMGNSVQMVQAHYHEAQELSTALEWFSVVPPRTKSNQKATTSSRIVKSKTTLRAA